MTPQFKTELQKLIDDAAEKHCAFIKGPCDFEQRIFKAGCEFLMPLIEELMKQRDLEFPVDESRSGKIFAKQLEYYNKDLLNLLRGVSDKA